MYGEMKEEGNRKEESRVFQNIIKEHEREWKLITGRGKEGKIW